MGTPVIRHALFGLVGAALVVGGTVLVVEWVLPSLDRAPAWRDSRPAQVVRVVFGTVP